MLRGISLLLGRIGLLLRGVLLLLLGRIILLLRRIGLLLLGGIGLLLRGVRLLLIGRGLGLLWGRGTSRDYDCLSIVIVPVAVTTERVRSTPKRDEALTRVVHKH